MIEHSYVASLLYVAPELSQGNFQFSNILRCEFFGIDVVSKFKNPGWNLWIYDRLIFIWQRQKHTRPLILSTSSFKYKRLGWWVFVSFYMYKRLKDHGSNFFFSSIQEIKVVALEGYILFFLPLLFNWTQSINLPFFFTIDAGFV